MTTVIARVHSVHLMKVEQRQSANDPQTQPPNPDPPPTGVLSDDAVWRLSVCLSRTSGRRAACAAGRLDSAYWLIGPGLAQGCRCALPLEAWAVAYRGGRPPTACYFYAARKVILIYRPTEDRKLSWREMKVTNAFARHAFSYFAPTTWQTFYDVTVTPVLKTTNKRVKWKT